MGAPEQAADGTLGVNGRVTGRPDVEEIPDQRAIALFPAVGVFVGMAKGITTLTPITI